ncbi:MAG: FAD-dependent monooxygenase [Candidatus Riflebacteria bacterium]|nr:FAD-dependent monooxygenase [Candidatus Riflebacteria bacterium]
MKLLIRQIEVSLDYNQAKVINAVASRLGANTRDIKSCEIVRRSLDARPWRKAPVYILTVETDYVGKVNIKKLPKNIELVNDKLRDKDIDLSRAKPLSIRPVIVGAGPSGLMAALLLARAGAKPILLERGSKAEDRSEAVNQFWKDGKLNLNNNVLFGEGGAGLFSDGKLTARSKDRRRIRLFFEELVKAGANPEILIEAEPHLGSDTLLKIIPNLRKEIISNGGEIRYNTALTEINIKDGKIESIFAGNEKIDTHYLFLATGHSARDIYWLLASHNVSMETKPTAI